MAVASATPAQPAVEARGAAPATEPAVEGGVEAAVREESLVVQTSYPGDVVLTTPLIAELAMRGPVDVVVTPLAAPVLANNPFVRHLFIYDKRGGRSGMRGLWRTARALRGRRSAASAAEMAEQPPPTGRRAWRVAYLAQGSVRSAVLAILAGYGERIGFSTSAARTLYTKRVLYRDDRHHVERLWRLAFAARDTVEPPAGALRPRLYPGDAERRAVDDLLAPSGAGERLVVLAPGSAWGTKRWPYFAQLAERLAPRCRLAMVGGPDDVPTARAILERAPAAIDATGRLSLLASAELIGRARLLVSNDSAPQHLASAVGTPTISVFGPTVPEFGYGPLAPRSRTAGHDALACRPCHHHGPPRCPLVHWRCMRELSVDHVAALATPLLD